MPRLTPLALRRAARLSPHAATLLPACRDLPSARNELRWIREHVAAHPNYRDESRLTAELRVAALCRRRGRGEPLQYVLGTAPFGPLEVVCLPGVMIPRCVRSCFFFFFSFFFSKRSSVFLRADEGV